MERMTVLEKKVEEKHWNLNKRKLIIKSAYTSKQATAADELSKTISSLGGLLIYEAVVKLKEYMLNADEVMIGED